MTPTYVLADDGKLLIYTILSIRIPGEYSFSARNSIKKNKKMFALLPRLVSG